VIRAFFGKNYTGETYKYNNFCVPVSLDPAEAIDTQGISAEDARKCIRWYNRDTGSVEFVKIKDIDIKTEPAGTNFMIINLRDLAEIKEYYLVAGDMTATPGFEKVDINLDGRIDLHEVFFAKRGKERCGQLQEDSINRCRVCYDSGSDNYICPNFTMP